MPRYLGPSYNAAELVHERFANAAYNLAIAEANGGNVVFWEQEFRDALGAKIRFRMHNQRSWDYIFNEGRWPNLRAKDKTILEFSVYYQPAMDYAYDKNDKMVEAMLWAAGVLYG